MKMMMPTMRSKTWFSLMMKSKLSKKDRIDMGKDGKERRCGGSVEDSEEDRI